MTNRCSALDGNKCRNGFPVNESCYGIGVWAKYPEDSKVYRLSPYTGPVCCNEDACASLYPETGGPEHPDSP